MTFEFDGVLGLGLASLAVDPEFSRSPSSESSDSSESSSDWWSGVLAFSVLFDSQIEDQRWFCVFV